MLDLHEPLLFHSHFSELFEPFDRHHNEPIIEKGLRC